MSNPLPAQKRSHERAAMLDRIYRRISHMDESSLASLDELMALEGQLVFYEEQPPPKKKGVSRRKFIAGLLLTGITAAGGGTAILLSQHSPGSPPATPTAMLLSPTLHGEAPTASPPTATPGLPPGDVIDTLQNELAAVRAERIALRAQLDSVRTEKEQLAAELQTKENDIAYLQQVVALYQQMEAVDLDNTIVAGLGLLGPILLAIQSMRSILATGISQAAALLATVEVQAPAIANGLLWLENQVNILSASLQNLEDAMSDFVEPVQPVAQQVGSFINEVLKLLPFGVGSSIGEGLQAIAAILTSIPELVASINTLVITPLRQWVSPDEGKGLVAEVVEPISANLLNPAQRLADETFAFDTLYHDQLKNPVEQALAARANIRHAIQTLTGVS